MNDIKLGVRLFSFRNQYPVEECFKRIKDMGADAFDITACQTVPEYPWPSEDYIKWFVDLYHKYDLKFLSYDGNIDKGIRSDRVLNDQEMFHYALNDIMYAEKFGARIHRIQWHLPAHVLEQLEPYCKLFGIKAGIEIHSPLAPCSPIIQEYTELFERVKSPWIGFVADFGAFTDRYNRQYCEQALKDGTDSQIVAATVECITEGKPIKEAITEVKALGASEADLFFVSILYHCGGATKPDFEGLKRIMPYVIHAHAKFYDFDKDGNDANVPVKEILKIFAEYGYDGYITSEYEGHMISTEEPTDMVKKQLELYRKILKEL